MRLEIEVLDGNQKGKRIGLTNGLLLGRKTESLTFADKMISDAHAVVKLDHRNIWSIECLAPNTVRIGLGELLKIALLPGLIFHLGQTGFKIVEKGELKVGSWSEGLITWLKEHPAERKESGIFFFLHPLRLTFVQGPQFEDFLTISYGPRVLGFNSLDLQLTDPATPAQVARFFQVGEQPYIENLCGHKALINSKSFDQHPIQDDDLLKIGSTIIELSILK